MKMQKVLTSLTILFFLNTIVHSQTITGTELNIWTTNSKIAEFGFDDNTTLQTRPRVNVWGSSNKINFRTTYNTGGAKLSFGTTSANDALLIDQNGNIGIGTINPLAKITVQASSENSNGGFKLLGFTYPTDYSYWSDNQMAMMYNGVFKNVISSNGDSYFNGGNVGIGTTSPVEKLEVIGYAKAGFVSIGGMGSTESPKNYINLASDNHGSLLLSSNLYLNGSSLYTANTHSTLSGSAIKIPGNGQKRQNNIEFWTTPTGSVPSGGIYAQLEPRMIINTIGNIGIGSTTPDEKLTVKGKIHAEEVKIDLSVPAPDYVFANDYKLKSLQEVEAYIKQNNHLPEIPSAQEIEKNGLMLAEMNMRLLKKMEEMTLYVIEMKKENEKQNEKIKALENKLNKKEDE